MNEETDRYLADIYYNPKKPSSFYSATKIWAYVKNRQDKPPGLNLKIINEWLGLQTTHVIHKHPNRKFKSQKIVPRYLDFEWQIDLLHLVEIAEENDGYAYLLVCVDIFSKYLQVRPLKTKTGKEVTAAFRSILDQGRKCQLLRSDEGKEFVSQVFQKCLKEHKIDHLYAYGLHKACFVERVNRTIQDRLYKLFYERQSLRYLEILDDLTHSYNHTKHGTTKEKPAEVTPENADEIYQKVYMPILNKREGQKPNYSFAIGDLVRLSLSRRAFSKGYDENWTEELFKIRNRIPSHPPRYSVADLQDERVKGSFYKEELQKAEFADPDHILYKIERIISRRKIRGERYAKIKWYGYSEKFNSWIKSSEVKDYKGR